MKKLHIIIFLLLVGISLFGQNVEIQGDATITGKVQLMDTILFADGTELASACLQVLQDADNDTKIEVEQSSDEDIIRFMVEGTEIAIFDKSSLVLIHNENSIFIGMEAGSSDDGDNSNLLIGNLAGRKIIRGTLNTVLGHAAGANIVDGSKNVIIGEQSGSKQEGFENTFIGTQSGFSTLGSTNTYVGYKTGEILSGNQNTAIGSGAGGQASGDGNIFLGYEAGKSITGGNKMVIDNSDSASPFLYGDLDTRSLVMNGTQNLIHGNFTIHDLDGALGGMWVNAASDGLPFYGFGTGGTAQGLQYMDNLGNWYFYKDSTVMIIDENDYVGIGTSTPTNPLSVKSSQDASHVVLIENTSNDVNADGLAIKINRTATGAENNFITFQDSDGVAGRIEGFSKFDGDNLLSFPNFDFSDYFEPIVMGNLAFDDGDLPTLSGGQLPSLNLTMPDFDSQLPSLDFTAPEFSGGEASFSLSKMINCIIAVGNNCENPFSQTTISWDDGSLIWDAGYDIFTSGSYSWDRGSFPTLGGGRLPSFEIDAIINPTPIVTSRANFKEVMCWALENGERSLITTNPFDLIMFANSNHLKDRADCKSGGVTYGSGGADYAEYLHREDYAENIEEGQIVGVKGGKISKNTEDAEQLLVISMMPIVLGNMPDDTSTLDQYDKVAFLGQAPVWVVGKVRSGDYIIPSGHNDGFGLAVAPNDLELKHLSKVVGRAWSDADQVVNLVNMVIGIKTNEMTAILSKTSKKVDVLEGRITTIEAALGIASIAKN